MNKLFLATLLALPFAFSACSDEKRAENLPYPNTQLNVLVTSEVSATENSYKIGSAPTMMNPMGVPGGFNSVPPTTPVFTFTTFVEGPVGDVAQVRVYKSFQRTVSTPTGPVVVRQPPVLQTTLTSFPATTSVNIDQALAGTSFSGAPLTRARLLANDRFIFTYDAVMKDGRTVVFTPLNAGAVSGTQTNAPYAATVVVVP